MFLEFLFIICESECKISLPNEDNSQLKITFQLFIKLRKPHIIRGEEQKMICEVGAPLGPVISFVETDLFDQLKSRTLGKVQEFIWNYLGFASVNINGRGFLKSSFGIIPWKQPITTVRR
jgi:hypothetical protein